MKQDIILAGVGGQGILSIAYVIDNAALKEGFKFKQAEVSYCNSRPNLKEKLKKAKFRGTHLYETKEGYK